MNFYEALHGLNPRLNKEPPKRVGMRDLSRCTQDVLNALRKSGSPAVITYRGLPQFMLVQIDPDRLSALALSAAPHLFSDDMQEADDTLMGDLKREAEERRQATETATEQGPQEMETQQRPQEMEAEA